MPQLKFIPIKYCPTRWGVKFLTSFENLFVPVFATHYIARHWQNKIMNVERRILNVELKIYWFIQSPVFSFFQLWTLNWTTLNYFQPSFYFKHSFKIQNSIFLLCAYIQLIPQNWTILRIWRFRAAYLVSLFEPSPYAKSIKFNDSFSLLIYRYLKYALKNIAVLCTSITYVCQPATNILVLCTCK